MGRSTVRAELGGHYILGEVMDLLVVNWAAFIGLVIVLVVWLIFYTPGIPEVKDLRLPDKS